MKTRSEANVFWDPRGTTGRGIYALTGCGLMALKFALDRLLVLSHGGTYWTWLSYWNPLGRFSLNDLAETPAYAVPLLILALPFIGIGVLLTLRRLRDAAWPLALVSLFFVPALNLVLFAMLCLMPSRARMPAPSVSGAVPRSTWARTLGSLNPVLSAFLAIVLTMLMITPLTWLATVVFKNYGWGLFVALPFVLGMVAAVVHAAPQRRTWAGCVGVGALALFFCGLAILGVAMEGAICLLMAVPIAAPLTLLGATVGYFIQLARWGAVTRTARMYAASWIALPFAFATEKWTEVRPELVSVTSSVEIDASPQTVWQKVVTFSELPPARELVFRSGIAYPVRATIRGQGIGAVRHCEFSTGPFVEPITVWEEPRRLAFNVIAQPHPMRELSPYRSIHPPHLENFFRSRRGEFLLTALRDGHTRLDGTTWYTQRMWPARYWQVWSDYLVHKIHARVLEHIRAEAERAALTAPPSNP